MYFILFFSVNSHIVEVVGGFFSGLSRFLQSMLIVSHLNLALGVQPSGFASISL